MRQVSCELSYIRISVYTDELCKNGRTDQVQGIIDVRPIFSTLFGDMTVIAYSADISSEATVCCHYSSNSLLIHDNDYCCYSHDNVYGAVIMTKVIARVHPVHLMNVD